MKRFHMCVMAVLVTMGVPFGSSDVAGEDAHWRTRPGHVSLVTYEFPDEPGAQNQLGYSDMGFYVTVEAHVRVPELVTLTWASTSRWSRTPAIHSGHTLFPLMSYHRI